MSKTTIHKINMLPKHFVVRAPDEVAREEGRQEVRDEIIAHMDIYAPHAVDWWKKFNVILKFDPEGR